MPLPPPTQQPAIRQQNPLSCLGLDVEDMVDWLDAFDRVCCQNRWDNAAKLNNAIFHLLDVAKTWHINHEHDFNNWVTFCEWFSDLIGKPRLGTAEAKRKLTYRVQQLGESYSSYIKDELALPKQVDSKISESEKKHVATRRQFGKPLFR